MERRPLLQSAPLAVEVLTVNAGSAAGLASATLKAYCYDNGFCVSALSLEDARSFIKEILPWPQNEKDDALVVEVEDAELDHRGHFFIVERPMEEHDEERSHSFRTELQRRMAAGETLPDTIYDRMCLIPDRPSYSVQQVFETPNHSVSSTA